MPSWFGYDDAGLVTSMTTPCGVTTFAFGETNDLSGARSRFITATDPLGQSERLEFQTGDSNGSGGVGAFSEPFEQVPAMATFNAYLNMRNTFYWDKHAYAIAYGSFLLVAGRVGAAIAAEVEWLRRDLPYRSSSSA